MSKQQDIFETGDGSHSVFSNQFGVSYHSKHGAIQETKHVFINAGLHYKSPTQKTIHVLGIGFGTGLNAFMTFLEAESKDLTIHYTAVEAFPIGIEMANTLNYIERLNASAHKTIFETMHTCAPDQSIQLSKHFHFTRREIHFQALNDLNAFDVIYFDAFAPTAQPELWEADLLTIMYNALKMNGALVTYCAKGVVKRTLKAIGFTVEALQGPPGKREMTRALKLPSA